MEKEEVFVLGPTHTVVAYELETGHIVHTLHQMTLKGGTAPDKHALEKEVLDLASRHHPASAKLGILHSESIHPHLGYKVDVEKRTLVEKPQRYQTLRPTGC
jgi:hypothetical protein